MTISRLVCGDPLDVRQHRDSGFVVVGVRHQRERPEMRRRPQEDQREERERRRPEMSGHGGPADQRRNRAGGAADHDVQRRDSLEPHRVDHDVVRVPGQREPGGERVHERVQQREARRFARAPRRSARRAPRSRRARPAAAWCGSSSGRCPGPTRSSARPPMPPRARRRAASRKLSRRRQAARRHQHRRQRRDQQQVDDARLGELVVVRDRRRHALPALGARSASHRRRSGSLRRSGTLTGFRRPRRRRSRRRTRRKRRRRSRRAHRAAAKAAARRRSRFRAPPAARPRRTRRASRRAPAPSFRRPPGTRRASPARRIRAAIQRWTICANWAPLEPVHDPPSQAGSVEQASPAPLELTNDPASIARKASPAHAARTAPITDGRTATRFGASTASSASAVRPPSSSIAVPQWTTTDQGVFERATVRPPSATWTAKTVPMYARTSVTPPISGGPASRSTARPARAPRRPARAAGATIPAPPSRRARGRARAGRAANRDRSSRRR